MEDALFNTLLFTGFYCLYSAMFAPQASQPTAVAVVPPAAVQQTTTQAVQAASRPSTTAVDKSIALVAATVAANPNVKPPAASAHNLEPDREPDQQTIALNAESTLGFANATPSKASTSKGTTRQPQRGRTATASGTGSESRR